jgi:hypothetical protein
MKVGMLWQGFSLVNTYKGLKHRIPAYILGGYQSLVNTYKGLKLDIPHYPEARGAGLVNTYKGLKLRQR